MIKINRNHAILSLFFVIALITISGCAKPECKTSSECPSKTCAIARCGDNKCVYTPQRNCCGNGARDDIENGKPGNQCTCPQDYGKCEGKAKVKIGSKLEDATFMRYMCNPENKCVVGVDEKDVVPLNFLDSLNVGFFKASSIIKYTKPFNAEADVFEFKITLDDVKENFIPPLQLTNIKIFLSGQYLRSELLIAEHDLSNELSDVGDEAVISVPLNLGFTPKELEESASIRYSIDYTYAKKIPSGKDADGATLYKEETARERYSSSAKQIFIIKSG